MPCCTQTNGLGQLDPATLMALNQAFVHAKDLWEDLEKIFGIGAGRREADVVVPIQEQITAQILAPVGDYLERVRTGQVVATCAECTTWQKQLLEAEAKWLAFLHTTEWMDGRAAQQGEATLKPIFDSQKAELAQCVAAKCGITGGSLPGITNPDGSINWPIVLGGAGLVYALTRRK